MATRRMTTRSIISAFTGLLCVGLALLLLADPTAAAPADPTVKGNFDVDELVVTDTGSLRLVINNNSSEPIEFLNLINDFPAELDVDPASTASSCAVPVQIDGTEESVSLIGITLAPGEDCTLNIGFTAVAEVTFTNNGPAIEIFTDKTPGDLADRTNHPDPDPDPALTVNVGPFPAAAPSITAVHPTSVIVGQSGSVTYTITNPNPVPLPDFNLSNNYQGGLELDLTNNPPTTNCPDSTITSFGSTERSTLEDATLSANSTCTFTVPFDATATPGSVITTAYQDPTPTTTGDDRTNYSTPPITITVNEPDRPLTLLDAPCPVYDSRTAGLSIAGTLDGGDNRTLTVTGNLPSEQGVGTTECVPDDATAVVFTISAIDPVAGGNLRLSPAGIEPTGGVVNYANNGLNNANTVTIPLSAQGQVDLSANGGAAGQFLPSTDARLVAIGYYSTAGNLEFNPITPCAVADSRVFKGGDGAFQGPFVGGAIYPDVDVVGSFPSGQGGGNTTCGVPSGADAVLVNVVAVAPTGGSGYLSVGPGGTTPTEPLTPFADIGMNNAATTIVAVDSNGRIAVDIAATAGSPTTQVRIVVLGYYDSFGAQLLSVTPCAAWDSRSNHAGVGAFAGQRLGGTTTTYDVTGSFDPDQGGGNTDCGVPDGASAVLVNLVAIGALREGNLRISATGTVATGGVLNYDALSPAMNNANAVVVPLSGNGQIDVFVNGGTAGNGLSSTHIRGVILGYYD